MPAIPKGYLFSTVEAGFRYKNRPDLALALSERPAVSAAMFTTNLFRAAPVTVAAEIIQKHCTARAVLLNAGLANACTGEAGLQQCRQSIELTAKAAGILPREILPGSTGVIGELMSMPIWEAAAPRLAANIGRCGALDFARAIMTTDKYPKLAWRRIKVKGREISVLGMAKGAGMICPDMATMLVVLLSDAEVESQAWRRMLAGAVQDSFNHITVDGDTSTNDTVFALANGAAGAKAPEEQLRGMLTEVCRELAYLIVEDGEGASKVLRILVDGARDNGQAELAARTVGNSQLVKTAMYGRDANWGRIVAALGRSKADFDPEQVDVSVAGLPIFRQGRPVPEKMDALLIAPLRRTEVVIEISLGGGPGRYELLASDLGHEYIDVNASYRS